MQVCNKVLVIGLDGATWTVLTPWLEDGSLPNLEKLRQAGCWGELRSTIPPLSAPAWSTFATGKNPGKHSVFHFTRSNNSGTANPSKPEIVDSRSIKSSTVWDILGHHQRKVGVINMPMTYPPRPVNGFMVTGLLTPPGASIFTYPPELSSKLTDYQIDLDRFIAHKPFARDTDSPPHIEPSLELMQEFHSMMEKRARAALALMKSEPWDLFMLVFTGTDRMGHYLWPYHRAAIANDSSEARQLYQAVHNYYARLDEFIGRLIEEAGEGITVLVISDHGMGLRPTRRVYCNNWLYQRGWLSIKTDGIRVTNPDGWLRRLGLPRDKIGRIVLRIPGLASSRLVKKAVESRSATVDVEQSQAYCVPIYNNIMGIRINPTSERKEVLRQEIMQELEKIVDSETGQGVVQEVYKGEDYYRGPYTDNVPDILVVMKPDYSCSPYLGHYSAVVTKLLATSDGGGHRLDGIFIASGPDVLSNHELLTNLAIEDVAPTLLYLMDLPVPTDMDGRVLTEILAPTTLKSRPIRQGRPMGFWPREDEVVFGDEALSEEDEAEIRERLQALGYLE